MIARYLKSGPRRTRRTPVIAHVPSSATVTVWTAAASEPTRELITPLARKS